MKCAKCGAELSDDTRFCSYCGEKVEMNNPNSAENSVSKPDYREASNQNAFSPEIENKTIADDIKVRRSGVWSKLSSFEKVTTVALIIFTLMCFIAFIAGKMFAGIIAVLSIALTVVALLMKKQIVKAPKSWIHIVALVLAVVLIVPYFSLFVANGKTDDGEKITWSNLILGKVIPQPKSDVAEIVTNTEEDLLVYIKKTSTDDFYDYIKACKDKGFTVDAEQLTYSFNAYNESGYKLSLFYNDSDKEMHIDVDAPVKYGELKWPDSGLGKLLPTPVSNVGTIDEDDDQRFEAVVAETSIEDFKAYAKLCSDKGFSIDVKESDKSFDAKNADGYKLSVKYIGNNVTSISIDEPEYQVDIEVECVENWIFSKYDVKVFVEDSLEGTLSHGTTETYSVTLTNGTYTVKFVSVEDDDVTGTVKIDITKDEDYKFKISCYSDKISVETMSGTLSGNDEEAETSITETTESKTAEQTEDQEAPETTEEVESTPHLTVENNADFASLMKITDQTDASTIKAFVNSHEDDIIEFDGCIALLMKHNNYKTRFDVCMAGGNYDAERVYGPLFSFEDVSYYDMKVSGSDTVSQGMNFRITAKIVGFNDAGNYIILEPVALKAR